jgi:gas vesicle protein
MKVNSSDNNNASQPFFSGFLLGGVVSSVVCYLSFTKTGRKIARELLRKAEEFGEEGQEYFEDLVSSPKTQKVKRKAEQKIGGIINKLKREVKFTKKS